MKENIRIESLEAALKLKGQNRIFRGHKCACYQLVPEIGRGSISKVINEVQCLREFERDIQKEGYFKQLSESNDFRILGLAQHYQKFPTRLLDWTYDIRVALYFACQEYEVDGVIWLFPPLQNDDPIWVNFLEENTKSPFDFETIKLFICGSFVDDFKMKMPNQENQVEFGNNRDFAQRSVMTIHPKNNGEFINLADLSVQYDLQKMLIPKEYKKEILSSLSKEPHWINYETLFQGKSGSELSSEEKRREIIKKFS